MSPKQIEVGKTYRNKGAGRTTRTVIEIGRHIDAPWFGFGEAPDEPAVRFLQNDKERRMYLTSFAQWAGSVV